MGYSYLLTIGHAARHPPLRHVVAAGPFALYATPETPVTVLPDGQLLLGHLFTARGAPAKLDTMFAGLSGHAAARAHLLGNCWGEYLLVQPGAEGSGELKLMRDPSGGVGCFYASMRDGTGFVTSDVSLASGLGLFTKRIDWDFVASCLAYPNIRTGATGLAGIRELLPGSSLSLRAGRATTNEAWSPWSVLSQRQRHADPRDAAHDVRDAVRRSVEAWAETDRSILLELSGGLDSSIVAACLKGTGSRVACCTVTTPVPGGDERAYARQVADDLGVPLQSRPLDFPSARYNQPPLPGAAAPCIGPLQCAVNEAMTAAGAANDVTSHFSGAGGDTVFGSRSNASPAADAFRDRGLLAGARAVHDVATLHQCTVWKAARLAARKMIRAPTAPLQPDHAFLAPGSQGAAFESHPWAAFPADALPGDRERIVDLAATQVFRDDAPRDAKRWLRMPLLSQPVVEACLRVPTWMAVTGGVDRAVARAAFRDLLPPDVCNRRSKGTFVAYSGSVYHRCRTGIRPFLCEGRLADRGLLDIPALERFFDSTAPPRDRSFLRIFELCMIENWVRHQR